ncbi:MAG: 50S ribosomal protein L18 [Planctomycetaceae bacterium]|nr:50S ribosomal protein L18 [Planctomycetaceae bacterium]
MKKFKILNNRRERRAFRVSNAVKRVSTRPRLCVFRSNKHIYVQLIDDLTMKTICSAGTNDKELRSGISYGGNCAAAVKIGEAIAKKAIAAGVTQVAFDRHGFKYHGRLKALADSARKAGLDIGAMPTAEELEAKSQKKAAADGKSKAPKKQQDAKPKKSGGAAPKKK